MRNLIVVGALLLVACGDSPIKTASQKYLERYLGQNVAAVSVRTLEGKPVTLGEALAGHGGVVNVWATWCAPCVEELPALEKLGQGGEVHVLAIATDKDAATVKAFLKQHKLGSNMTVLWDSQGAVTTPALGSRALPASYVVDGGGTIRMVAAGAREWASSSMREQIKQALE